MGVIHTIGEPDSPPSETEIEGLHVLSTQAGTRVGMLRSMAKTQMQATTDGLTGLINRRAFETRARALQRTGQDFAILMADLDHFKALNDTFGHAAGDAALRAFADAMHASVRSQDLVARFGGEEFVLLLHGADTRSAAETAERIREALALRLTSGDVPQFTASFGAAGSALARTLEELIRLADSALYVAKEQGRNRVVLSDGEHFRPMRSAEMAATQGPGDTSDGLTGHRSRLVSADPYAGFAAIAAYDDPLDP